MKTKILMFIIVIPTLLFSQSIEEKYAKLKAEYDKLEREYWQEKQDIFVKKETYKITLDVLEEELKLLYSKKNSRLEEKYLLKEGIITANEEYDEAEAGLIAFKTAMENILEKEHNRQKYLYPQIMTEASLLLAKASKAFERGEMSNAIEAYSKYREFIIDEGSQVVIDTKETVDDAGNLINTKRLRLGFTGAFALSDDERLFILTKGGGVTSQYEWKEIKLPDLISSKIKKSIDEAFNKQGKDEYINVPFNPSLSQSTYEQYDTSRKNIFETLASLFRKGGIVMFPLSLVAIVSIILSVERIIFYVKNSRNVSLFFEKALPLYSEGRRDDALKICEQLHSPIIRVVLPIMRGKDITTENAENIIDEMLIKEIPSLEKRLSTLAVLAAIAPLLGLLGTVSGMISLFEVITLFGTGNPKILAGGISEALLTTQVGLSIAIPVMFVQHFLSRAKDRIVSQMERSALETLNTFEKVDKK